MSYLRKFLGTSIAVMGVAIVAVGTIAGTTWGQCELEKLLPSDGEAFDEFGNSVAISGDLVIVGAHEASAVYIYRFNGSTWEEEAKLVTSNFAIGVDGNAVIVGAPLAFGNQGAIYLYRFDGLSWIEEATIRGQSVKFGFSVAISGDVAIAGEPFHSASTGRVKVYRFVAVEWLEEGTFVSNLPDSGDQFGLSVGVDGDFAIVGEPGDDDNSTDQGKAYILRHVGGNWSLTGLVASDGMVFDNFGAAVAISGDVGVVGAWGVDDNGSAAGAAYVFRFNGKNWEEEAKLLASDGAPDDNFGFSVSISGDLVLVGSDDAAYLFRFDGSSWVEEAKLEASDGVEGDGFGTAVAIDGDLAVSGARFDNDNGEWSGSAYVFSVDLGAPDCNKNGIPDDCEPDCNGNGIADECDIADGTSADCNENGVPDECDVADGTSEDCDGDEVPDDCQILYFVEVSPPLGPIGDGVPQTYVLIAPPEVSPQPGTQVLVSLTASADLGSATEWIDVFLNDQLIGTVFEQDGKDCSDPPDEAQLVLDGEVYSELVASGDAEFQFVASFAVDPELCQDSFITIQVEYQAVTEDDCNGNAIPDICDILFGGFPDKNGNWIPDECEDTCLWDLDANGDVGVKDLLFLLGTWGPCPKQGDCPADFDNSGDVGVKDLLFLLGAWGPCP